MLEAQDPSPDRYQQIVAAFAALCAALVAYIAKLKAALNRKPLSEEHVRRIIREEIGDELRWRDYGQRMSDYGRRLSDLERDRP